MTPKPAPNPHRTIPDPDDVWIRTGAALRRFIDRHGLSQRWVADAIGMSQPHVSFLVGNHPRDDARPLRLDEMLRLELKVRKEIDQTLVLGEIARDSGLIEDPGGHPIDVVMAYPHMTPGDRAVIADLIERSEARYLAAAAEEDQRRADLPRLVRGTPEPRRGRAAAGSAGRSRQPRREAQSGR